MVGAGWYRPPLASRGGVTPPTTPPVSLDPSPVPHPSRRMSAAIVQVREAVQQLPPQRRLLLGAVVVGVVAALLLVARWASQPDYALLFGSLAAQDAGRVVEQLEADGVTYDLRDGGTAVYVPRDEVYGLRLRLATEGVVTDGPAGYELFDGGTLGMTDFMQKLNVKRALEGELARTIGSVRQIQSARVHLVLPERSPFRDQQTAPSASVVLSVRGSLAPEQVSGVTALVAGAVEGLEPTGVTVLDEAGRLLASPLADAAEGGASQVQARREVEDHLAGAGQSMLDRMLGPGRAVVRVAADLDLSTEVTETAAVDPESQTVISEETQQEAADGGTAESRVRNFEVTRETRRAEREAGQIRTLTVSVLLDEAAPPADGRPAEDGARTAFSDEQVRQIEALVKNAVGYDEARGDRFAVQQIRFTAEPDAAPLLPGGPLDWAGLALRYLVVLVALFMGYRLLRRLADGLAAPPEPVALDSAPSPAGLLDGPDAPPTVATAGDVYAAKLSDEAQARLEEAPDLLEDVRAHVVESPEAAAALVRAWLREDAERDALA